jgi:cell division protein ZapA (FtsZ GTPase activity inhibitor)
MVEILGRTLTLRAELSPDYLRQVAQLVDEQLRQLQRAHPASPLADLAILTALNLACECLETKEDYQQLHAEIEARSRLLIQMLEAHESHAPPGP